MCVYIFQAYNSSQGPPQDDLISKGITDLMTTIFREEGFVYGVSSDIVCGKSAPKN